MTYIELAFFIVGSIVLVIGYRRNKRELLLVGAFAWLLSAGIGDFTQGFLEGFARYPTTSNAIK